MRLIASPERPIRRVSRAAAPQIALAAAAIAGVVSLGRAIDFDEPFAIDLDIRALARSSTGVRAGAALAPLFPIGLPGGYITIAYATAHWLHHKRRRGGPAIVTAAWLGWLVHRGAKLVYFRKRPPGGPKGGRSDSYPSGHTTGTTALATTAALALRRQKLISPTLAGLIGVGAPALMGVYRVLADDHWATDVAGGWMLGGAIGLACNAVLADAGGAHDVTAPVSRPRRPCLRSRRGRPTYAT